VGAPPPGATIHKYNALDKSLNELAADVIAILLGSLGAMTVFSEYSSGLIRTTLAAVPARRSLIAAKVVVVTAVTTVAGAIIATVSFFVTQAMLAPYHLGLSITAPGALRAVTAFALFAPLSALAGMALAALFRHTAASVVATVGVLLILPQFFGGDRHKILKQIGNFMPLRTLVQLKLNPDPAVKDTGLGTYAPTLTLCWIIFASWAVASIIITMVTVDRRDV
jgi:hypothetical protein